MAQNFDEWMSHNEKRYAASSTISPTNDALSCVSKKKHDDYANVVMEMKSSQQFNFNNDEIDFDDGFGFSSSRQHPSPSDWESDHFQTNNFQQHSHIPRQQYHSEEFRGSPTRIRYVDPSSTQRSAGRPRHRSRGDVSQMKSSKPKRQGRTLYRERDNVNGTSSQRSKSTIKRNSERTMALAKLNTSNNDDISSDVWSSFEGAGGASWVAAGSRLASGHRHQMQQAQKAQQPQRQPPRRLDSYGSSYSTHTPPQVHHNDEGANSNSASSVAARRRRVKSVAESRQRQQQQQQQNQPSKSIALSPPPSSSASSSASVSSSSGARRNMRMRMQNRSSPAPSKTANTSEGNSTPVPQQQLQSQLQSVSSSSFDRSTSMASMNSTEIDNEVNMAMNELKLSGVDIAIFKNTNTVQTSSSSSPKKGRTSPMTVGTKSLTLDSATIVSTRGNEVGKSLLTNTISVDQHSESSSLTNDTSDWQGQSGGNNMFKDANASTFHKSKRIVRPHEMKGGVSDQQLPLEEQSQPKSPSMKDRISQYKTASSASCSGPSSPPNKLAQISKNSRDVQTEQLEQSKPPLSPTGNRVKNSPFLKNEENNSNSSESAKSPVPSSSSKSKRHHHVSPTPFISQSEISQTGLTVARGSSKVSNESKTPTKDVATLMKERIATANSHRQIMKKESSPPLDRKENVSVQKEEVAKDPRAALMAMLNKRANPTTEDPPKASSDVMGDRSTPVLSGMLANRAQHDIQSKTESSSPAHGDRPSLKDDPKYAKYMKMLKVGMPLPVVQHAMTRDGLDPTILEGDHNEPVPEPPAVVPLNEDPAYTKYFKMLKLGLPLGAVKNAMERDGVNSSVMDGDHNAPASASKPGTASAKKKQKDTHRRTRLHWETLGQVNSNSVWAALADDEEMEQIEIDETEFTNLFQAEIKSTPTPAQSGSNGSSSRNAVQVIDPKRANNGGIILARLRMSYDDMAMVVDSVDETKMTANQVQGIIEYMPTPTERKSLRTYMKKSGGGGTEEKFDKLCECEKFMVAMISVKQSRMKLRALLFKLQFRGCIQDLAHDVFSVEKACDELSNSVKLRKLFGIVLNVGNRLNTAGPSDKRKASAFSIQSLLKLNQAKAFDNKTTFLQYVVLVVQRNNEKLLNFKDDLPTVAKADKIYWDQCINELEEMETQLEIVRKLALHDANSKKNIYSLPKKKSTQDDDESENLNIDEDMSLEEEVSLLRSTKLGMFALGAIKKVSQLRERVDIAKDKFARLLEYFGEDGDSSKMDVHELFAIINTFCGDFEAAREVVDREEQAKKRAEKKEANKLKTIEESSSPMKKNLSLLKPSSLQPDMSNVLAEMQQKKILASLPSANSDHPDNESNIPASESLSIKQIKLSTKKIEMEIIANEAKARSDEQQNEDERIAQERYGMEQQRSIFAEEQRLEMERIEKEQYELEQQSRLAEIERLEKKNIEQEQYEMEQQTKLEQKRLETERIEMQRYAVQQAREAEAKKKHLECDETATEHTMVDVVAQANHTVSNQNISPKDRRTQTRRELMAKRRQARFSASTQKNIEVDTQHAANQPSAMTPSEKSNIDAMSQEPIAPQPSSNTTSRAAARDRYARHKKIMNQQRQRQNNSNDTRRFAC